MSALPKTTYTLEEYLEIDRNAEERLEFWEGEIYSMSGASDQHDQIETNLVMTLGMQLRGKGYRIFSSNFRIKVPSLPPYRYGDASALCGKPEFETIGGVDVLTNPQLIVEVLSKSTASFDLDQKFSYYKSIPSFAEYILIAQDRPHVKQFIKQADNAWLQSEFSSLDETLGLVTVGCELSLREIYQNVVFAKPENPLLTA